jgi:hypothetical protein
MDLYSNKLENKLLCLVKSKTLKIIFYLDGCLYVFFSFFFFLKFIYSWKDIKQLLIKKQQTIEWQKQAHKIAINGNELTTCADCYKFITRISGNNWDENK